MDRVRLWTAAIFLFVFGDAMAMQARGPILAPLERTFGVSESVLGLVAPAGTAGFVVVVVATGLLAGRISVQRTLLVSVVAVAVALVAMAAAPLYVVFLLALLAQGAAAGAFRGVDRVVLSHLYAGRRGRVYTAYALMWAVGAVAGPQLVSAVLAVADWRAVFLVLVFSFVPTAVVAGRVDLPEMTAERSLSLSAFGTLLRRPSVVGSCTGLLLFGAVEGIMFTWLSYYASQFAATTTANLLLSAYLLAYIPARFGYTLAVDRVPYLALVLAVVLPAIPALVVVLTVSGQAGPVLFLAVFVAGAGLSSGFPILSAYAVEAAPAYTGPLNALTTGATYTGIAVGPAVVGVLAELYGIGQALWLAVAIAGVLFVTIAGTWLWTGTATAPTVTMASD
ncbi:MFS transporter [Natrinema salifodinae]|uniref:Predicted arabinose efflux permease, MFS family n=1 Tax=Natrinema salifodinae TaxID=1202768 RepID=A0A1I0Q9B8_9EURY|nr:MFS transporter [Natrinema salifodinae]SEW23604.1 Predicted arabinose efflux permease, MFS family [Natrinema salifodinae]